jgi:hypothetical protein
MSIYSTIYILSEALQEKNIKSKKLQFGKIILVIKS